MSETGRRLDHAVFDDGNQRLDCHVLLVEDSPGDQRLVSTILTKAGAEVTLECNGQAAVHLFRVPNESHRPTFDVILMDLEMPVLDGIGTTRQLRAVGFKGPIIALTACTAPGIREEWLDAGCDAYLTKPFRPATLLEVIRNAMGNTAPSDPPAAEGENNQAADRQSTETNQQPLP